MAESKGNIVAANKLRKAVKKELKQREPTVAGTESLRRIYVRLNVLFFLVLGGYLGLLARRFVFGPNEILGLESVLTALIIVGLVYVTHLGGLKGPKKRHDRDQWLCSQGRRHTFASLLTATLIIVAATRNADASSELTRFFLWSSWASYLAATSIMTIIAARPKFFVSNMLNGVGTAAVALALATSLFSFLAVDLSDSFSVFASGLAVATLSTLLVAFLASVVSRDSLTPVQQITLKIIRPERLLYELEEHSRVGKHSQKASRLFRKIEKNEDYGVQLALLELLAKKHDRKPTVVWAILGSIGLFVLSALGEAFFQDLLYDPWLKPILCKIDMRFC